MKKIKNVALLVTVILLTGLFVTCSHEANNSSKPTWTVTFNFGDYEDAPDPIIDTIGRNKPLWDKLPPLPEREGFTCIGWYDGETKWEADTKVTKNTILRAKWVADDAETPTIVTQPNPATYNFGGAAAALTVGAYITDGGRLSYQWYSAADEDDEEGLPIAPGGTANTYFPSTDTVGSVWYWVVVTNTNDLCVNTIAQITSARTLITINNSVNAQEPIINVQPLPAVYNAGAAPVTALTVGAYVTDGGILTYQWYSAASETASGSPVASNGGAMTYTPPVTTAGSVWYYVVVTNTNNNATGTRTATTPSNRARITVNALVNALEPSISTQPQSGTYTVGQIVTLTVQATTTDGGALTYQWYSAASADGAGSPIASGGTAISYIPSTAAEGDTWYWVEVTNTNNNATGTRTAPATSNKARITVNHLVNAQPPTINVQPIQATHNEGATGINPLMVGAYVTDGGTVTYRWYSATSATGEGSPVASGGTASTYTPSTATAGSTWYYVVVTNTNNSVNGVKTATATSDRARIIVNALTNAQVPTINVDPLSATYIAGGTPAALTVGAYVTDGGILGYQWYSAVNNTASGSPITPGGSESTYMPPIGTAGSTWYYVVVTNTNNNANNNKVVTATSGRAEITVKALVHAAQPSISTQPQGATYDAGATTVAPLTVVASRTDDGILSYQWYSAATDTTQSTTSIYGATSSTYRPPVIDAGTTWYYVAVTNTKSDATGLKTATTNSTRVRIIVNALEYAEEPNISTQPESATYSRNETASLSVTASVNQGTLSYQWWYSTISASDPGAEVASGGTASTYSPSTDTPGDTWYWVVITNTNNSVTAPNKTKSIPSARAKITVNNAVNARRPIISIHPQSATYNVGATPVTPLGVTVSVSDGGELSYQWYSAASVSVDGSLVATTISYTPPVTTAVTTWYYVVVTNTITDNGDGGTKTATATSDRARIIVNPLVPALTPNFREPLSATYNLNASTVAALTVAATSPDGGTLSYQWYRADSEEGAGTTVSYNTTYTPSVSTVGSAWYWVVITNTNNNATTVSKTATATSARAQIIVNPLVNALQPSITYDPVDAFYDQGSPAVGSLTVAASLPLTAPSNQGTLRFQWYKADSATGEGTSVGNPTTGTSTSLTPSVTTAGNAWYYVVVTNDCDSVDAVTGSKTATITSNRAQIIVLEKPTIITHPESAAYTLNTAGVSPLEVQVKALTDGGTLSYQWYRADSEEGGGSPVTINLTYTPPVTTSGSAWYWVVVTNTRFFSATNTPVTTSTHSTRAVITVNDLVNAKAPNITQPPTGRIYTYGDSAVALTVTASSTDGGSLSYQWYRDGVAISGATSSTYTPSVGTAGIAQYYVAVTNTNNSVDGVKTATVNSSLAVINVSRATPTAADFIIENLEQTYGSLSPVTITPNEGKSDGDITILYDYKNFNEFSATASAVVYTVTFNVAETGNYNGVMGLSAGILRISPKIITNDSNITIAPIPNRPYTGNPLTPTVTVKDGSQTLTVGVDYSVAYTDNFYPGTATATITGMGNYSGSKSTTFTIVRDVSSSVFAYYWVDSHDNLATSSVPSVNVGGVVVITPQGTGYEIVEWQVDGVVDTSQKGNTYGFSTNNPGQHIVTLIVKKNGKLYSTNIVITVQ